MHIKNTLLGVFLSEWVIIVVIDTPFHAVELFVKACEGGESSELSGTLGAWHGWMAKIFRMRQIKHLFQRLFHARCPPICLLRSMAVAPSSRLMPRRMAFLPKRALMLSTASCILRSLASSRALASSSAVVKRLC